MSETIMRTARSKSLIVLGVCLVASAQAHAQPLFPRAQSIESTVANADLVFIAKLVKFGDGKQAEGREVHEATIAIEETLKKDLFTTEPYERLSIYVPGPASVLADWTKRSCRLLVAHDSDAPKATEVIELVEGKLEVWKADMTLLRKPDSVIRAAREAARRMPAGVRRVHTFGLKVPRELIAGTKWEDYYETGGHLVLSVPVDRQLEKRAQDYLRSESYPKRAEGVRALRYFKSDENIARVRALLNDPGRVVRHHAQDNKGVEAIYVVRIQAYETLQAWEIDVKKPVLRENVGK
jgi:hypothetical protein